MPCLFGKRVRKQVRDDAVVEDGGVEVSTRYTISGQDEHVDAGSNSLDRQRRNVRVSRQGQLQNQRPDSSGRLSSTHSNSDRNSTGSRASESPVGQWLIRVEPSLGKRYFQIFQSEGFDSLSAVQTLTEGDLIDMDVKSGHRRVLLPAIALLKESIQHALPAIEQTVYTPQSPTNSYRRPGTSRRVTFVGRSTTTPSTPSSPTAGSFPPLPLALSLIHI